MADVIEAKLTGDLFSGLNKLLGAQGEQLLRAGGFAGAEVFQSEAVQLVPVRKGIIKRNIIVKRIEEKSNGATLQTYYVTVRKGKFNVEGDAFYWRWVEYGHSFVRRKKNGITWKAHREAMQLEYGSSSAPAQPFMRPAYDRKKNDAIAAMQRRMAEKFKELIGIA